MSHLKKKVISILNEPVSADTISLPSGVYKIQPLNLPYVVSALSDKTEDYNSLKEHYLKRK